jgi:Kef-type K+ transport system membrane component KefB
MDILLLAIVTYLVIIFIAKWINKYFRLPWMFTVVILGLIFSTTGLFREQLQSDNFLFLSKMGMLFFLFTIGVDLDWEKIRQMGKYIIIGDILLTLTEGVVLGSFFYFVFPQFVNHSFIIALLAGIAFGTVGEVILLAILKEFGLEKTKFGQLALGIGVFDDIFEISVLAIIIAMPEFMKNKITLSSISTSIEIFGTLVFIFFATWIFSKMGKIFKDRFENIANNSYVIPFSIFLIIFSFMYFSSIFNENLTVIAAIFSGISVNLFFPEKLIESYKKQIYFIGNIFLGPFFFLSLGSKISFDSLISYPLLILAIILISLSVRVIVSYLLFNKLLGKKQATVLGVGLCAKFSTSVVSENIMFTTGLIAAPLYSAIMAAFILMKPIIIGVFSRSVASIKDQVN